MIAAMGARTSTVRFSMAALIAPFYEPIRLAEDLLVLDNLTKGRVDLVIGGGYVSDEFAMYGVPTKERVRRVIEVVSTLRGAFSGEPSTIGAAPSTSRQHPVLCRRQHHHGRQQRGCGPPGRPYR